MTPSPYVHDGLDMSAQLRTSNELVKRIRKLRWMGMEEEARTLQQQASRLPSSSPVIAVPTETD